MGSLLLISLFIGMRHALEADHVAAVASLVYQKHSLAQAIKLGGAWGLGHTIVLFLTGSIVIFFDTRLSEQLAIGLEVAVGIMLILLGANMLRRVIGDRVRYQGRRHKDGHYSFHTHSHTDRSLFTQGTSSHDHHPCGFPLRALLVGSMHGMAGSAALILLALEGVATPLESILYILLFGIGSMLGMMLLSLFISVPMRLCANRMTFGRSTFPALVGSLTITLGIFVICENRML